MRQHIFLAPFAALTALTPASAQQPTPPDKPPGVTWIYAPVIPPKLDPAFVAREQAKAQEALRYKGISVTPQDGAIGATLQLHRQIATLMNSLDYVPESRLQTFDWLKRLPVVHTGWRGRILSTTAVEGGYQVKVMVVPKHTNGGDAPGHFAIENYLYSDGELWYLGSTPTPGPKIFTF